MPSLNLIIFIFILENTSPVKNYIHQTPEQISTIQFENEISPVATNGNLNRPCAWQNSKCFGVSLILLNS